MGKYKKNISTSSESNVFGGSSPKIFNLDGNERGADVVIRPAIKPMDKKPHEPTRIARDYFKENADLNKKDLLSKFKNSFTFNKKFQDYSGYHFYRLPDDLRTFNVYRALFNLFKSNHALGDKEFSELIKTFFKFFLEDLIDTQIIEGKNFSNLSDAETSQLFEMINTIFECENLIPKNTILQNLQAEITEKIDLLKKKLEDLEGNIFEPRPDLSKEPLKSSKNKDMQKRQPEKEGVQQDEPVLNIPSPDIFIPETSLQNQQVQGAFLTAIKKPPPLDLNAQVTKETS